MLPPVGDSEDLGIQQVDLQVKLRFSDQTHPSEIVTWKPQKGWTDINANPRTVIPFALTGLGIPDNKLDDVRFESKFKITTSRDVFEISRVEPALGQAAITSPFSVVEVVTVDGSALTWNKLDPTSNLLITTVELKSGDRSQRSVFRPRNVDDNWLPPKPLNWLVLKPEQEGSAPVTSKGALPLKRRQKGLGTIQRSGHA